MDTLVGTAAEPKSNHQIVTPRDPLVGGDDAIRVAASRASVHVMLGDSKR
jgi:hypothetical protein